MKRFVLVADSADDLQMFGDQYAIATTAAYVSGRMGFEHKRLRVINLSRSFEYQSMGYYTSLLAEARGHRVLPTVETALNLASRDGYSNRLPEFDAVLAKALARHRIEAPESLLVYLGQAEDERFSALGRRVFEWFGAPIINLHFRRHDSQTPADVDRRAGITRISIRSFGRLSAAQKIEFARVLAARSNAVWQSPPVHTSARFALAVLHDPAEILPPSSGDTLRWFARMAEKQGVAIEPIARRDLARLAEFDALFIRETTSIRDHTFTFARRARAEGMPVIDDPVSMIRCTNKIYLWEILSKAGLPTPPTMVLRRDSSLDEVANRLTFPLVLKVPDGSFSRGVKKAADMAQLRTLADDFFRESELLLAQRFMPTEFDWRIGVLAGKPLFACQYLMARNHWQIVNHRSDGRAIEGGFKTVAIDEAPSAVMAAAVAAAKLIGDGFYGVDLKETRDGGVVVIEVNDNPNLEHGVEDKVEGLAVWQALLHWFAERLKR